MDKFIRMKDDAMIKGKIYRNSTYQVIVRGFDTDGELKYWLSIKRLDKEPIHDWRDLQEIKNQLGGSENEAVEIYPAESRKVDGANQYHLWVFKDGFKIPIGFNERLVNDTIAESIGGKQRPLTKQGGSDGHES